MSGQMEGCRGLLAFLLWGCIAMVDEAFPSLHRSHGALAVLVTPNFIDQRDLKPHPSFLICAHCLCSCSAPPSRMQTAWVKFSRQSSHPLTERKAWAPLVPSVAYQSPSLPSLLGDSLPPHFVRAPPRLQSPWLGGLNSGMKRIGFKEKGPGIADQNGWNVYSLYRLYLLMWFQHSGQESWLSARDKPSLTEPHSSTCCLAALDVAASCWVSLSLTVSSVNAGARGITSSVETRLSTVPDMCWVLPKQWVAIMPAFGRYLIDNYCMPSTALDPEDPEVSKACS